MVKKSSYTIQFELDDYNREIRDSVNIAKWNPHLALKWMETVSVRIISPIHIKQWNNAAIEINNFWDSLIKFRWYDPRAFWGNTTPKKLTLLDEIYTLEDYAAMSVFDKYE